MSRPDLVGFVNPAGAGLVVIELKKPGVPARAAFDENLTHSKAEIPQLFWFNAVPAGCIHALPSPRRTGLATVGPYLSQPYRYRADMNAARYFIRREDDELPRTPVASPFRKFDVRCLKCSSYRLRLASSFDEGSGELRVALTCPNCQQTEELPVR